MKDWMKLLICVLIAMLVTVIIGLEVNRFYTLYTVEYIGENVENYLECGKSYGEQYKNAALNLQQANGDSNYISGETEVGTEYLGVVCLTYSFLNALNLYNVYYMLLIFGAICGVMAYFIFVKKTRLSKLLLIFIISLAVLSILYYFIVDGFAVEELLYCLAGYTVIVVVCYMINLCRQALNKKRE